MRRFLSITTIVGLLASMLSPVMAAACTGTGKAVSCHAAEAMPHCDRPMHEHHHHDAAIESKSESKTESERMISESVVSDDAKCPMDCCTAGHVRNGAAISATNFLPPLAISDQNLQFVSVTFTSVGFSSHTDRGPPAPLA